VEQPESEELYKEGSPLPFFLELPVKEPAESVKRKMFWEELIKNVEPYGKEV
jgi:hypothetical protein